MADISGDEGETLEVDYSVENTSGTDDTQDIILEIEDSGGTTTQEDSDTDVTITAGSTATGTLSWVTESGDADTYTAFVKSNDDTESISVEVSEPTSSELNGYLLEDWEGDSLNEGPTYDTTGYEFTEPETSAFTVTTRPEWSELAGSPTVSDSILTLTNGDSTTQAVDTEADVSEGTWEFVFQCSSSPTDGQLLFDFMREDTDNRWRVRLNGNNDDFKLQKQDTGDGSDAISTTWSRDTSEHTLTVTRDSNDQFEMSLDGSSVGTATDSFTPSGVLNVAVINAADTDIDFKRIEVY